MSEIRRETAGLTGVYPGISRRNILLCGGIAALSGYRQAAAAVFWESKPASRWTPDEIAELVSKSPWAKQVSAQYRVAMDDPRIQAGATPVEHSHDGTVGECGLVPCSNVMPGKVVVIWESAQPIREAIHPATSPELNDRYVISVRGLAGNYAPARLKAGSDLRAKGKSPLQPGVVLQRNNTWVFGFSKELLPLGTSDRDVEFTVRVGANLSATLVRASFNPKEMVYRGELAL